MNRIIVLGLTILVSPMLASISCAQQACPPDQDFCQAFHYDYYRNKMWPMPFRATDSRSVLQYFEVQRNNGWKLNNTIGASMFQAGTGELTESGKAHLKWIVTQAPQNRKVVFVLQGDNQQQTAARVEATQLAVSELVPIGPLPQLYLTNQDAPGSSGVYQTAIHRAMTTSVPSPRLSEGGSGGAAASSN